MPAQMNTSGLPTGELLGRYRSYDDAQKVVDHMASAEGFDIKALSIVGNDLRTVESIRTRLSYPRVALAGAAQGSLFGGFIGLIFLMLTPEANLLNVLAIAALGAGVWMIAGIISYAIRRGSRDFASSQQLTATTYDIVCDYQQAQRARTLVREAGVVSLNAQNDPTGRSVNLAGPSSDPVPPAGSAPLQGVPAGEAPAQPSDTPQQAPASGPRPDFQTLPDGRPRYGARLADYESSETEQKPSDAHQTDPDSTQSDQQSAPQPDPQGPDDQDTGQQDRAQQPPRN